MDITIGISTFLKYLIYADRTYPLLCLNLFEKLEHK